MFMVGKGAHMVVVTVLVAFTTVTHSHTQTYLKPHHFGASDSGEAKQTKTIFGLHVELSIMFVVLEA